MDWSRLKQWLPLVALAPAMWLGLYIVFWLDRADCAEPAAACLGNGFGNWLGDLVMLQWVDTTLGAGLLATVAALSVIWTAYYQRHSALNDAVERRIVELTMIMWMVKNLFERAGLQFSDNRSLEAFATLLEVTALFPRLHEVNPALVALLQFVSMDVQRHVEKHPEDWGFGASRCLLLSKFFNDPRRLFDGLGNYVPNRPTLGDKDLDLLRSTGHAVESIDFASGLFTWDRT